MLKRFSYVSLALVAASAAATWSAAGTRAAELPVLSDIVVLQGNATIISDGFAANNDPVDPGVPAGTDPNPSVDLRGGAGSFTFVSGACAGWSDATEVGLCTSNGGGNFVNTVCGTGAVSGGSATLTGPSESETISFAIAFTGGIGIISGSSTENSVPGDPADSAPDPIHGVTVIAPGANPDGMPDCTHTFTFIAAVVSVE